MLFAPDVFRDQVAVVTGGGTGIGRATALMLAGLGARVAIASRKPENLAGTAGELLALAGAGRTHHQTCDIREPDQVAALVGAVVERFGRIDLLVNNAGGQFPSPAEMISPRGWDAVIRNNLNGTFYVTREVATRAMIPQKAGRIVNVIAQIYRGFPGMAHTGAARAGVENLTRSLAVEWAQHRITVNAVAPGVIRSSGTTRYPAELLELGRKATPLKRLGREDEVAEAIGYLLSAGFVTGATLYIDGGARLWGDIWEIPD